MKTKCCIRKQVLFVLRSIKKIEVIKSREMGRACGMCRGEERYM
jgi:hypothetical protein